MDHKDALRQEYINHKESIKTINLQTARSIPIPNRNEMILTSSLPTGFVEKHMPAWWSDYKYEYAIEDGMVAAWNHVNQQFKQYSQNNATIIGLGGINVAMPTNANLHINSGFRNPERQERLGSATCSKHMLGKAVDMSPTPTAITTDTEKQDKALKYYVLWRSVAANPPTSSNGKLYYQIEKSGTITALVTSSGSVAMPDVDDLPGPNGDGVPDALWGGGHLHINVGSSAGACP